jgi:hypothetical protein
VYTATVHVSCVHSYSAYPSAKVVADSHGCCVYQPIGPSSEPLEDGQKCIVGGHRRVSIAVYAAGEDGGHADLMVVCSA